MKVVIAIICTVLLTGCVKNLETRIPIIAPRPNVDIGSEPELPIKALNAGSSDTEIIKAYVSSIMILKRDNTRLRNLWHSQD